MFIAPETSDSPAREGNIRRLALCAVVIRGLLRRIQGLTFF
jgi:hypothetical protein